MLDKSPDKPPVQTTIPQLVVAARQHHTAGNLSLASQICRQILQEQPSQVDALLLLGSIAQQSGNLDLAVSYYQQVITLHPLHADAHTRLGSAYRALGHLQEAICCYNRAIALMPDSAAVHFNLGNALHDDGKITEAIASYQEAISLKPNYKEAYVNQAIALKEQGKPLEAIARYRLALAIKPKDPYIHFHLSLAQLLAGDFSRGFAEYEWRWEVPGRSPRRFPQPLWDGKDLKGKKILLHAEQGFGDAIQFIRYAPLVAQRGGRVIVGCYEPLRRLFETVAGVEQVSSSLSDLPEFDVHAPLMSLPYLFGTTLSTVPAQIPYLAPPSDFRLPILDCGLGDRPKLKVGIVWAGNLLYQDIQRHRSCQLTHFLRLLDIPGVAIVSLQKDSRASDIAQIDKTRYPVQDLASQLNDFADTAAVVAQLDLVITVDTAVAHLAGALGKQVWVLLPFAPDWRWMLERDDSPWYPTMRLFRQSKPGDWEGVFARVEAALATDFVTDLKDLTDIKDKLCGRDAVPAVGARLPRSLSAPEYLAIAISHHQAGRLEQAKKMYARAIAPEQPDRVIALNNLGIILKEQGKLTQAIACYQEALHCNPNAAHLYNNLANVLQEQGDLNEAVTYYQKAIALAPNYAQAYYGLGNALQKQGHLDKAIGQFQQAIALKPNYLLAHINLANTLQAQGFLKEALTQYNRILEIAPNNLEARLNRAFTLLLAGDFRRGFAEYECRREITYTQFDPKRTFSQPLWDGKELEGKKILLHAEQGFGDTIQFIRYVPIVAQLGGRVIVECPEPLLRLFATVAGIEQLVHTGAALPDFDVHAPLMSLPGIFGTTLETIPASIPYLAPPDKNVECGDVGATRMDNLSVSTDNSDGSVLHNQHSTRVGIVWAGKPLYQHDITRYRSCALIHFLELLDIPEFTFISLQTGPQAQELKLKNEQLKIQDLAALGYPFEIMDEKTNIATGSSLLNDFADTATIVAQLDLVITVDTAVAHLAGALGRQVWVLLPFAPDWRWMLERSDSPWYPTMRLFRQNSPGDWKGVFKRVRSALSEFKMKNQKLKFQDLEEAIALAIEHCQAGRLSQAEDLCRQILQQQPEQADALHLLGAIAFQHGELETAQKYYQQVLTIKPNYAKAHNNMAIALKKQGKLSEAIAHYQQALEISPNSAEICNNLGNAFLENGQYQEAIACFQKLVKLRPDEAEAYCLLGKAFYQVHRRREAIACLEKAVAIKPEYAYAHYSLGNALRSPEFLKQAIACYQKAIALEPKFASAHTNLGMTLLLAGDFRRGFAEYEWRWERLDNPPRPFPQPRWDGKDLEGRKILLHAEQGFGDAIQFIRYAPAIAELGGRVIVECPATLLRLFSTVAGIEQLVPTGAELPDFDCHAPLMSLPYILGTTLETIPAQIPYLAPPPGVEHNSSLIPHSTLNTQHSLKVGIVWAGSPTHPNHRNHSCQVSHFLELLKIPGVGLYSLQKGPRAEELKIATDEKLKIQDLAPQLNDFADTAAYVATLDIVITVDTAVAHLAGALGRQVWVLLPFDPDWRWMLDRSDSPWYPTMRLFRQSKPGDWEGVFEQVRAALATDFVTDLTDITDAVGVRSPRFLNAPEYLAIATRNHELGRLVEAEQMYRQVLQQQPNQVVALNNLGIALKEQGKLREAIACYEKALAIEPNYAYAYYNLGNLFRQTGQFESAIAYYQKALALQPNYPQFHNNIGLAFYDWGMFGEAIACYQQALNLDPNYAEAHNNMGNALYSQGKMSYAIACYERAIFLKPNSADFHKNLSHALLRIGDFRRGFALYEWRKQIKDNPPRTFTQPQWDGSNLKGRTILLHTEQGFGDAIQFIRYAPLVAQRGGRVFVACFEPLLRLFKTVAGVEQVYSNLSELPEFDVHAPLMSLPHILGTTLETIPAQIPYLAPPSGVEHNSSLIPHSTLNNKHSLKVGIVWAGNSQHPKERFRACQLTHFITLLEIPGVAFYSLQKGSRASELNMLKNEQLKIQDLVSSVNDFADTAAYVATLDLVITIDTSVAHLAGALGRRVWVLLHFDPDWRWMLEREDSPWYPTMRLFRQSKPGDWDGVFEQVSAALREIVASEESKIQNTTINQEPSYAEAYYNQGNVLKEQGKIKEAIAHYSRAIALKPNYINAHYNLGNTLLEQGKIKEAIANYQEVIKLDPDDADTRTNYGFALLISGDLKRGFAEYEWRRRRKETPERTFPQPMWDGSDLTGRTILLHHEEGFGDTIQFIRYAPKVAQLGGRIIVESPQTLVRLLSTVAGIEQVVIAGAKLPDFDVHIPIMSLPRIFGTTLETIPAQIPYLAPPSSSIKDQSIHTLPFKLHPLKVGIVWTGSNRYGNQRNRSCKLAHFLKLLDIPGVAFYSLQFGPPAEELTQFLRREVQQSANASVDANSFAPVTIQDLAPGLKDFADTAAVVAQLDLVITIDTAVAHLAGALGKPVWVLLPFVPDWRWLLDREDSPWYPSMRLFRQSKPGDWEGVFERVYAALQTIAESKSLGNVSFDLHEGETMSSQPQSQIASPAVSGNTIPQMHSGGRSLRIGISWQLSAMNGWGVYGLNLTLQLLFTKAFSPVLLIPPDTDSIVNPLHQALLRPVLSANQKLQELTTNNPGKRIWCDFPVLVALGNNFGTPAVPIAKKNIGLIFFEDTNLTPEKQARAKTYDMIVAGSNWNAEVLKASGIPNVRTVQQGIDPTIFHPAPKSNLFANKFVIFSGGKLEYRKGQDILIAAFKQFRSRHPEALLVTAWHNFWPEYMLGLDLTGNVIGLPAVQNKRLQIGEWLVENTLPADSFIDLGLIPNPLIGQILREADVAVFPSRCEGGTNLVAMESMACGIPTVLSANTGHLDLIGEERCYPLRSQRPVQPTPHFGGVDGWGESDVEELVETLEKIYADRVEAKKRGLAASVFMQEWTWEKQVNRFLEVIKDIL